MKALTKRQYEVLEFIKKFKIDNGYYPTRKEIGENFGFTVQTAQGLVKELKYKGFIKDSNGKNRSIIVKDDGSKNTVIKEVFKEVLDQFLFLDERGDEDYGEAIEELVCIAKDKYNIKL